jgi:hypothetical protein
MTPPLQPLQKFKVAVRVGDLSFSDDLLKLRNQPHLTLRPSQITHLSPHHSSKVPAQMGCPVLLDPSEFTSDALPRQRL